MIALPQHHRARVPRHHVEANGASSAPSVSRGATAAAARKCALTLEVRHGGREGACVCVCVKHLNRCKTSTLIVFHVTCCCSIFFNFVGFNVHLHVLGFIDFNQFPEDSAGGSSTIASLLPTKTLAIGGDTRPDQSGVPATFRSEFSLWQGAKPRTPTTVFVICIVAAIWNFILFYDFQVFDVMDDSGIGCIDY